ncbi:helix-turn-helix transcriptional regulator [Nocardiopsis sp. HNM0947]|uniref:Helix-turn-helix transcriptional regulator n=1 Tax=Nocardiopsis coralli TaxID=2772213 RepID=A0ABR9P8L1_9ACTN|nr:helix-turn-helix transcriptional regulator [Nocardiopsis coralli]MBE3000189.1 helix-turn-helix transcriptional regulator [Nocardiopsis coralli]
MAEDISIGDTLRDLRAERDLTQEGLAEAARLHVNTVRKIEQGGTGSMETYHRLARVLGTTTGRLVAGQPARRQNHGDDNKVSLLDMRRAITPPVGLDGHAALPDEEPDLADLRGAAESFARSYHSDRYRDMATLVPRLVTSAHAAVNHYAHTPQQADAHRVRSEILQLAGRYLTQVRAYDLAQTALTDAVRDAATGEDRLNAAASIIGQAWVLLRQGRLDEAQELAAGTADQVEPRMSRASGEELAAWGWLLLRASAAAARNNRPDEAREAITLARTAGVALGGEVTHRLRGWVSFGPTTVELKAIENEAIADRPDRVLSMSKPLTQGSSTSDNWNRHMLDVAKAHARMRHDQEATHVLSGLVRASPQWLSHQRLAADTFAEVRARRKRALTSEQRKLAALFAE